MQEQESSKEPEEVKGTAKHKRFDLSKEKDREEFRARAEGVKLKRREFREGLKEKSARDHLIGISGLIEDYYRDPESFAWARRMRLGPVLQDIQGVGSVATAEFFDALDIDPTRRIGYMDRDEANRVRAFIDEVIYVSGF